MHVTDTAVRLIPRPDGSLSIHDARTGRPLGVLPSSVVEVEGAGAPLESQIETATVRRQRERRNERTCGLLLGTAFVTGVCVGVFLTYL